MKECIKCHRLLEESGFEKERNQCRRCRNDRRNERNRKGGISYEKQKQWDRRYIETHREYVNAYNRKKWPTMIQDLKLKAFSKISNGKIECSRCGCPVLKCLEVNHIHGGGTKDTTMYDRNQRFYRDVVSCRRKTDDLNLLCRGCNGFDHLERIYGKQVVGSWDVKWTPPPL